MSNNFIFDFLRDILAPPTQADVECHAPKPILIASGRVRCGLPTGKIINSCESFVASRVFNRFDNNLTQIVFQFFEPCFRTNLV